MHRVEHGLPYVLARSVPLAWYRPFRVGIVSFRRGSLPRKICAAVLKIAARANRGRLNRLVSEIRPIDALEFTFSSVDSMVMDAVYWTGLQGYEGRVAEVWKALCGRASKVLEVGGNVGLFTVIGASACAGAYHVVEPLPRLCAILRDNLGRNHLDGIHVYEGAAIPGSTHSTVALNVPDEGRGAPVGSHLVNDVEISGRSSASVINVTGWPFRDLIVACDLVKIDAEGIEAELLGAARDVILSNRPTMLIEVLPGATNLAALVRDLARAGNYSIYIVPEWGSDTIVSVNTDLFTDELPGRYNSKDIVMSVNPLPVILAP